MRKYWLLSVQIVLVVIAAVLSQAAAIIPPEATKTNYQMNSTSSPDQPIMITPTPIPTPTAFAVNTPDYLNDDLSGIGGSCNPGEPGCLGSTTTTGGTTINLVKHVYVYKTFFNNPTARDSLINYLNTNLTVGYNLLYEMFNKLVKTFWNQTLPKDVTAAEKDPNSITSLRMTVWNISGGIAVLLMPLTLLLSILTTMMGGTKSPLGFASGREALINWMVSIGIGASSFWWLGKITVLTDNNAKAIFDAMQYDILKNAIFNPDLFQKTALSGAVSVVNLAYLIVMIILLCVLGIAVLMAIVAREAILFMMIFLTLPTCVLSNFGPLRFLRTFWLQGLVTALLLLPMNAFMLSALVNAQMLVLKSDDYYHKFIGVAFSLGIISILIGINRAYGDRIMEAVYDVGRNAWDATQQTLGAIAFVVVAALTYGASLGAEAAVVGTTEAVGASETAGALNASTPAQAKSLFDAYNSSQKVRTATNLMGSVLKSSDNRGLRSIGNGLQVGNAFSQFGDTRLQLGKQMMGDWKSHFGQQFSSPAEMPGSDIADSTISGFANRYPDDSSGLLMENLDQAQMIMQVGQNEFGFGYGQILKDGFNFPKSGMLNEEGLRTTGSRFQYSYALQKTYGTPPGKSLMGLRNNMTKVGFMTQYPPDSTNMHPKDLAIAATMFSKEPALKVSPQMMKDASMMVNARRMGGENYSGIMSSNHSNMGGWLVESANGLTSSSNPDVSNFANSVIERYQGSL